MDLGGGNSNKFKFKLRLSFLGQFYCENIENISLKAPGNYSASFRFNIFLITLLERPKTTTSMISRHDQTYFSMFEPLETAENIEKRKTHTDRWLMILRGFPLESYLLVPLNVCANP